MATIKVIQNGPYLVQGDDVTAVDWNDATYTIPKRPFALCRCGGSTTKPFCDGTHSRTGFKAAEAAVPGSQDKPATNHKYCGVHKVWHGALRPRTLSKRRSTEFAPDAPVCSRTAPAREPRRWPLLSGARERTRTRRPPVIDSANYKIVGALLPTRLPAASSLLEHTWLLKGQRYKGVGFRRRSLALAAFLRPVLHAPQIYSAVRSCSFQSVLAWTWSSVVRGNYRGPRRLRLTISRMMPSGSLKKKYL
jgi:CDGSH-type Zn-finger protein